VEYSLWDEGAEILMDEQLLTAEELAERLAVSERTVIEWARVGLIPEVRLSRRIRRFDFAEVVAAVREGHCAARPAAQKGGRHV
jgi:excisionase family DNA binding protein